MGNRPTFKCVCTSCGWRSARGTKNMHRPCPKCGGPVGFQSQEELTGVQIASLIAIVLSGLFVALMAALGADVKL